MAQPSRRQSRMASSTRSRLYLVVWGWLFVLSTCSYLVDYLGLQGYLRWSLILLHDGEGRPDPRRLHAHGVGAAHPLYAILMPPIVVLVFVGIMVFESNYTELTRILCFGTEAP